MQTAPNFLQQSELRSHVKPVVIIPDPEPDPVEADALSESDHQESVCDMLVDTSSVAAAQVTWLSPGVSNSPWIESRLSRDR